MIYMLLKVGNLPYIPENVLNDWALEPSRLWQRGEATPEGTEHDDCGFNLTLPNHAAWDDAAEFLDDFFTDKAEMFQELIGLGAVMELNVGLSLDKGETLSAPLQFHRALLAALVAGEVQLNVIAFNEEGG